MSSSQTGRISTTGSSASSPFEVIACGALAGHIREIAARRGWPVIVRPQPSRGVKRLPGLHCYDIYAGPEKVAALFEEEPGTYLLTDYLVRTFDRTVLASLGLDRHPELWPDYFGHYTRLVWLAQEPTPALAAEAARIAAIFGLPLARIDAGTRGLEAALAAVIESSP